jgi:hypothetical protein
MLEVNLKDVDQMVQPEYTSWITNMEGNIDTTMLALPKGSSTLRIRAELKDTLNVNYPDYTPIYTEGPKMEERVGCAVVTPGENKEIRLQRPFSIFNAEAEAMNAAISITRNTRGNQQKLQNRCRRLEKLDKGETGRNKTTRMDII